MAVLLAACGGGGGASELVTGPPIPPVDPSKPAQILDTWTDLSTDTRVPATDLLMAKIATTATNTGEELTSTTVKITGSLSNVTNVKVWWNTVDNFETAILAGQKDKPITGESYDIPLSNAGKGSGFLFFTVSLPFGQSGTFQLTVSKISGATTDNIQLPHATALRLIMRDGSVQWVFNALSAITTSPAVAPDGTIYFGSDDKHLYAVHPNGLFKWRFGTGGAIKSSPAIAQDGTIFVGSTDRQIYAIHPNGTLRWVIPTKTIFTSSPAIARDGTVYIAGTDQDKTLICSPAFPVQLSTIFAREQSGTITWSRKLSGAVDSSPAISKDGIIYIGSDGDISYDRSDPCGEDFFSPSGAPNFYLPSNVSFNIPAGGHLYAFNSNGTLRWDFKTLGDVDSSPAIAADGTIYVGSDAQQYIYGSDATSYSAINPTTEGYLYAIAPNGTLKWYRDLYGDVDSSPVIAGDGTIYIGSDKNDVFALEPTKGALKWVFPTRSDVNSSPAVDSEGTIYIGSDDANLYALNPDGTIKWQLTTGNAVQSSPAIGNDGTVYIGSNDSNFYAIGGVGSLMDSPWPKFRHDLRNTGRY